MAKGGRRPGAGRPTNAALELKRSPGSEEQQAFVLGAQAALPEALLILTEMARGIYYEGCSRCKKAVSLCACEVPAATRIYQKPPDRQALEILVEHGRGRAAQAAQAAQDTSITLVCNVPRPAGARAAGGAGKEKQ